MVRLTVTCFRKASLVWPGLLPVCVLNRSQRYEMLRAPTQAESAKTSAVHNFGIPLGIYKPAKPHSGSWVWPGRVVLRRNRRVTQMTKHDAHASERLQQKEDLLNTPQPPFGHIVIHISPKKKKELCCGHRTK